MTLQEVYCAHLQLNANQTVVEHKFQPPCCFVALDQSPKSVPNSTGPSDNSFPWCVSMSEGV